MNLRRALGWCLGAGGVFAALPSLGGCGDAPPAPAKTGASAPDAVESIEHEACDPKASGHKAESFDTRGDGKPVVIKVYNGSGKEICRITDINHDGKPDLFEYFDAGGNIRRRESDYDANGTIDSVEFYEGGKLVKREYDTTGQHRVDTWDYFDKVSGKRLRRERDTTNDGKVDQWWTWDGDKITIAIDRNGDGQPDPGSAIVLDEKTGMAQDAKDAKSAPAASASTRPADGPPPPTSPAATPAAPATSASAPLPTLEHPFAATPPEPAPPTSPAPAPGGKK